MGRSTRAGNAQIHGMTRVTPASIAYVAMLVRVLSHASSPRGLLTPTLDQVRFVLGSATCFSRKDTVSDSERFYLTVYDFLTNPQERQNVGELLQWWDRYVTLPCRLLLIYMLIVMSDRQVFPNNITSHLVPAETSALARLLALRTRANILS